MTPPADQPSGSEGSGRASTIAAFAANLGVAAAKFVAWGVTGSASLLAEAVHSVADSGNQGLLLWGQRRARQRPTSDHPFGFGRERYFWALVVAIILFTGGGLFALFEGEEKLRVPHQLSSYPWSAGVLLLAMVLEGASLRTAVREAKQVRRKGERWSRFVRRTTIPELAVVLLEDSGALIGLVVAFAGTTAAELTGNPRFDALGSIGIGVLLAGIAFTLAVEMKSLLIGEAAGPKTTRRIIEVLEHDPLVARVREVRTEHIGPDQLLVVGTVVLHRTSVEQLTGVVDRLEQAVRDDVDAACLVYLSPRISPR